MSYVPIEINLLDVCGLYHALKAMRLPYNRSMSKSKGYDYEADLKLASKLIMAGDDHAKAFRGIVAYLRLKMQVGFMIEFETYRHGVECLSTSSSMHNELRGMRGIELADRKQAGLPKKVYTRIVMVSYQALRNMYCARRKHRHPDWGVFCEFVESLPYFNKLIYPEVEKRR